MRSATPEKRHVVVFGAVMTRDEALTKALELSDRGDHTAAARVLDAAGLWPHDLIERAGLSERVLK
jgi:hypothetical protein